MTDDELSTIVQAFREENTGSDLDAAGIRRRVLTSCVQKPKRRLLLTWFLPAAVLLLGSTALAGNGTVRLRLARSLTWLDRAAESVGVRLHAPHDDPMRTRADPKTRPLPSAKDGPAALPNDAPPFLPAINEGPSALATPDRPRRHGAPKPRGHAGARVASTTPPQSVATEPPASPPRALDGQAAEDGDVVLYRAAHRLHFREKDPGGALVAWDAYLAAFPSGKLTVEAHFNRALCLIKLGRTTEAEAWLEKFASGAFGSYRRSQAADLLEVLRRRRVHLQEDRKNSEVQF